MKGYRKGYRKAFQRAFPYTIPVLTGYLFIGIAFGVMFSEKGYSFLWAGLMSLLVYAGSGQYLAVNFFAPGVSFLQVIFLTLMVNIRHIFYGISLLEKFHGMGKKRWYMIFGLTDETYSLLCTTKVPEDVEEDQFLLAVSLLDQSYWVIGSMIGGIAGNFLPFDSEGIVCHDGAVCSDLCGTVDGKEKPGAGGDRCAGGMLLPADLRGGRLCTAGHAADHTVTVRGKEKTGRG